MPPIAKIGSFLNTDSEGYLLNECRLEFIREPWKQAVEEIRQAHLKHLPEKIHSLYLRGSLPRGKAIEGISDIDTFAVINTRAGNLDFSWIEPLRKELLQKYPFVSDVEFHFILHQKVLRELGYLSYRFIIKNLSLCLEGEDLAPALPRYKPGLNIAFAFHGNIQEVLSQAKEKIQNSVNDEATRRRCQWVMKRILRTGFSMLMGKEKVYTRDLYPCYEVFSKNYPEQEPQMRQALEWAVNPVSDQEKILEFLNTFGDWVAAEARQYFSGKKT